ncbi:MAG: T9SS type A sorting domain-containing protein [Bacteroidia bacterium]|nr:T9SS type A sorting domain-containing protein [Bacteroidia bacterium]
MKKVFTFLLVAAVGSILSFSGSLMAQTAPVNDSVCNAIAITDFDTLLMYTNIGAGTQAGEDLIAPSTNGPAGTTWNESGITHSVWFTFIAPPSGAIKFDLCNDSTDFDTQLAVYEVTDCNNFSSFNLRGANDDIDGRCPVGDEWASIIEVNCLVPGAEYYLIVDGWVSGTTFDSTGRFGLVMSEIPASVLSVSPFSLDPTCTNTGDGIAAVAASGGDLNYTYLWNTGSSNSFLPNVGPGTYTVTVRDGCDSARTATIVVNDPGSSPLVVSGPDTVLMCKGGSVNIGEDLQVKGGVPLVPANSFATRLDQNGPQGIRHKIRQPNQPINPVTYSALSDVRCGDFAFGAFFTLDNATDQLYAINTTNGTATPVGSPTGVLQPNQFWLGMAFDPTTSTMYATTGFGGFFPILYTIDIASGAATIVDTLRGVDALPLWLACDNNGNLYAGETLNDNLVSINKTTAEVTNIGYLGTEIFFVDVQDADFDPITNQLYMVSAGQNDTRSLLSAVDVTTGLSVPIGAYAGGTFITTFGIEPASNTEYSYTWTPNNFITDINGANPTVNPPAGFPPYQVIVRDECGDIARDTIFVQVQENLTVNASSTADDGTGNGSATVTLVDGVPPYTISWNTGATSETISGLQGDSTYTYTVSDTCGTVVSGDVFVVGPTSNEELVAFGLSQLEVYPNPASNFLFISIETIKREDVLVKLLDAKGAQVNARTLNGTLGEEFRMDISDLPGGMYVLQVSTSEGTVNKKIVKK